MVEQQPPSSARSFLIFLASLVVLVGVGVVLGAVLFAPTPKKQYDRSTPDQVLEAARDMVINSDAERLTELVYADSPEMQEVYAGLGAVLGHLQDLAVAINDRFPEEVAEATGLSLDQVMDVMSLPTSLTSLNQSTGEDGDAELGDFIEDESTETPFDAAARAMVREDVRQRLLGRLSERESKILSLRYGLEGDGIPRTLEEVGADFNLTRERIRQIETRALSKLRHPSLSIDPESLVAG